MGKERISATVDKETIARLKRILKKGKHRNNSHIIEDAIKLYEKELK